MFECKACAAKDQHIASLERRMDKAQDLCERVVAPVHMMHAPAITRQADIALGGAGEDVEPEPKAMSEVEKQALQLLTGAY